MHASTVVFCENLGSSLSFDYAAEILVRKEFAFKAYSHI